MGMSIDNYGDSLMNVYADNNSTTSESSKLQGTLSDTDFSNASDEELMSVCKQFESYFMEQVYKSMEKMVPKDEDEDSSTSKTVDYFKSQALQELTSNQADTQSLGLAQTLYESMKREYNI